MPRSTRDREPQLVDRINASDDEEIDEDAAFNSDDELTYGNFFSLAGKNMSKGKKAGDKNLGENSDDDNDDESDDDDDSASDASGSEHDWAGSSDSEDEDDDGGQYMLDLLNNLDKQVPSSGKSDKKSDKTPGKGEGGRIALNSIASEAAVHLKESEYQSGALAAMSSRGGEADDGKLTLDSLMGGIADTAGFASVQKSMRALSSGVSNGKDEGGESQKKLETTATPVARVVSERASRKVHYQATQQDVTQWKDAVHEQRDAETLDFRTNAGGARTNRITRDTLVEKFEATNDFEVELQEALEKAGMEDEKAIAKKEKKQLTGQAEADDFDGDDDPMDDDLGGNHITMEEYKKRHGELAKLRSLMFNEEQKRHRINKIKSKKYRKIRKRQRDRLKDAEDEAAQLDDPEGVMERERIEREEMDRMQERMSLAHKNTSKWARRVLRRGKNVDVEERRALSLQIAKGEELRRKVMGVEDGSESEEETEERLLQKARDILMEDDDDNGGGDGKKKGLFQLEFMKRGMETQRARAKEEARKLLEELEANEVAAMSSDSEDDDYDKSEKGDVKAKKQKVASEEETNKVLPEGKLVASSLQFGKADGFAVKVDGNIELKGGGKVEKAVENDDMEEEQESAGKGKKKRKKKNKMQQQAEEEPMEEEQESAGKGKKKRKKKNKMQQQAEEEPMLVSKPNAVTPTTKAAKEEEEENPWIASKSTKKSKKPLSHTVNINEAAAMLVDTAQDNKSEKRKRVDKDDTGSQPDAKNTEGDNEPVAEKEEVGVADLSQAELVRRAFAAPADLHAEEEFQKEKERMKERDDPTRKKKEAATVTGWGSWAGAGAPPPMKKKRKLPLKLQAPVSKKADKTPKRKDDGMGTVIINEKRLKKTAKFQLSEIPYPYRSRAEYERAIAGNIGQEWNTMLGAKEMSRPAVLVRAGKIIQPIGKKSKNKQKRAPAKF